MAEPDDALPHMYAALEAIQRARAAERIYLRGRARPAVINLDEVRLAGKRDGAVTAGRVPLAPAATAARLARLLAHATLLATAPGAARDSLLVLRLELLPDAAGAAAAIARALDALREGGDPRPGLAAARAALAGAAESRPGVGAW
jgi:hypothetical protein